IKPNAVILGVIDFTCRANQFARFPRRVTCQALKAQRKALREKSKFARGINADLPVRPSIQKICLSFFRKSCIFAASRAGIEGRYGQSSRNVGRGMRWTHRCRARELRADERHLVDDEGVWSWRPLAGAKRAEDDSASDGDYEVTDTGESTR